MKDQPCIRTDETFGDESVGGGCGAVGGRMKGGERRMRLIEKTIDKLGPIIDVTVVAIIAIVLLTVWALIILLLYGVVEAATVLFAPFCDVILQYLENALATL